MENTYLWFFSEVAIRFREGLRGFSCTNFRDIVSLKAIDLNEWLKAPDDFFNTRNGKTNATFQ